MRIWQGNDREHRASYVLTARTVNSLGKRTGNGVAPTGERPPKGTRRKKSCHSDATARRQLNNTIAYTLARAFFLPL